MLTEAFVVVVVVVVEVVVVAVVVIVLAFESIRLSHNSTEYLHTCLVKLCCTSIGKYETDDQCYNQLGWNVTANRF